MKKIYNVNRNVSKGPEIKKKKNDNNTECLDIKNLNESSNHAVESITSNLDQADWPRVDDKVNEINKWQWPPYPQTAI